MADDQPPPTYYSFSPDVIIGEVSSADLPELPASPASQELDAINNQQFSQQGQTFDLQKAFSDYLTEHPELIPSDPGEFQDLLPVLQFELLPTFQNLVPNVDHGLVSDTLNGILDNSIQGNPQIVQAGQPTAADPVNMTTGQFEHSVTDFTVPGAGLDFVFTRTYKSGVFYRGPLGSNWDHSANLWLRVNYDGSVTVTTGQLRPIRYILNSLNQTSPFYVAVGDDNIVVATTDGAFEQRSPNGLVIRFENLTGDGVLYQVRTITDRFSNVLAFHYQDYLLSSVTVNNAARIVSLSYDDLSRITNIRLFSANYIFGAGTESIARTWAYSYDDFGDLVALTGPATDDFPLGRVTQYSYSSSSAFAVRPHDLLCITDPNGQTYLENEYGADSGTVAFGRVVSQCVNTGVFLFEWEDVLQDPSWTYSDAQCPTSRVTIVQRNGHSVCYVLSANGNILFSRESILGGSGEYDIIWRYAYDDDGRRIATLSPQGRVTQVYYGREYYYDQNYPVGTGAEPPPPWLDVRLSVQEHNCFSNVLATVQRSQFFGPLAAGVSIYDDIFTQTTTTFANDIITNYTYEGTFQQLATASDPRSTNSAVPGSYAPNLMTVTFDLTDPAVKPTAIRYPDTTYPIPLNGVTGVTGAKLTYDSYDAQGRLLHYTLPEGNSVAYSYFPHFRAKRTIEGFLASKTLGVGSLNLVTRLDLNEAGQTIAVTDPRGNTTQFGIDPSGLVRATTLPLPGYVINLTYDGNSQVVSRQATIVEPDGSTGEGSPEVTNYEYNPEMSPVLISVGDSSGAALRQTRRDYDPSNCLIRIELPRCNSICYEYDERLLLKQVTRGCCAPEAATMAYAYDLDGLLIVVTDPRGGVTTSSIDAFGRRIGITDPLGTLQRIDYDKLNNVVVRRWFGAATEGSYPLLFHIEYEYDERNQLIRERNACFQTVILTADPWSAPDAEFLTAVAAGAVDFYDTLYFRDGNLRTIAVMDANGNATTFDYDAADRRIKATDPTGSFSSVSYDASGNIVRVDRYCVDTSGIVRAVISTLYEFDAMNRLFATTDGAGNRTATGLDSRGLARTQTDALGDITEWDYNSFRDQVTETKVLTPTGGGPPANLTTAFSYDPNSNIVGVTDPLGNTTVLQYDLLDRLISTTNPDGTSRTVTYDRSGNQIKLVDEDGVVVNQSFDLVNNVLTVAIQSVGTPASSAEQWATFRYNGASVLVGHENAFLQADLNCDSLGRCYEEILTFGSPLSSVPSPLNVTRQFDGVSNLKQLGYPSGQTLQYSYDAVNRLIEIDSVANARNYPGAATAPANREIIQKNWWGFLQASAQLGNGIVIQSSYDSAARRIADGCSLSNSDPFVLQQLWNGAGNRRLVIENYKARTAGWRYDYDSTNRLTGQETLQGPGVVATGPLAPPISPLAPLALDGQSAIDTVVNGYSAIPSVEPQLIYDAAGSRTSQRVARGMTLYATNSRNEYVTVARTPLTYSQSGRLINDKKADYAYNSRGQLVQATSQATGSVELQILHDALGRTVGVFESGVTRVLVPNGRNAIEMYDDGTLSAVYIYEGRDQACFFAAEGQDQYVVRDVLESTRLTTDAGGSALGVFRYDSFGTLLGALLVGAPATPVLYSGKYRYASIGWYDFQRRQYIPRLGRFAQPDPAGFVDGANLYSFVANNPLSAHDPTGTDRQTLAPAATQTSVANSDSIKLQQPDDILLPEVVVPVVGQGTLESPQSVEGGKSENDMGKQIIEGMDWLKTFLDPSKEWLEHRLSQLDEAKDSLADVTSRWRASNNLRNWRGRAKDVKAKIRWTLRPEMEAAELRLEALENKLQRFERFGKGAFQKVGNGLEILERTHDAYRILKAVDAYREDPTEENAQETMFSVVDFIILDFSPLRLTKPLTEPYMKFVEENIKKGPSWEQIARDHPGPEQILLIPNMR